MPASAQDAPAGPTPPKAPLRTHVMTVHGDTRVDPYFWLRDREDPATLAYLSAENAWTDAAMVTAFALTSGAVARFLGGGINEISVGVVIGIVTGLLAVVASKWPPLLEIYEPVAASAAAFIAGVLSVAWMPFNTSTATLSGLIVLIPGFMPPVPSPSPAVIPSPWRCCCSNGPGVRCEGASSPGFFRRILRRSSARADRLRT